MAQQPMMKAQVFRGVNQLRYEDVPIPVLEPDEVLVKVEVAGLSRLDIKKICHPFYEPPRIFGEEIAGTIASVGDRVTDWWEGQRVVVIPHIPCLRCAYCLQDKFSLCKTYDEITTTAGFIPSGGGFAEYVKVPSHVVQNGGLIAIPGYVNSERASFVYPVNCCLKAIEKAKISPGQIVLVVGVGGLGLLLILLAKYFGARPIATDLRPARLDKALAAGAEAVFLADDDDVHTKINSFSGRLGVDTSLLSAPTDFAFFQGLDCTRKGGKIILCSEFPNLGIPINPNILYRREIDLMGSHGANFKLKSIAADIVFNKRINLEQFISDRFSLKELPEAIDRSHNPTADTCKILILPNKS
ncbi:MAG: alcohol dehydrogenase catalytic domain-containing protein [Geitlerinemataceae cyanobacterium]